MAIRELGRGSERIVYDLMQFEQLLPGSDVVQLQKERLLAKESLCAEDDAQRSNLHYLFCKTQQQVSSLHLPFLQQQGWYAFCLTQVDCSCHHFSFPSCYVYQLHGSNPDGYLNVLVEKKLDCQRWIKWNLNDGRVFGVRGTIKTGDDKDLDENAATVPFNMHARRDF